MKINCVKASEIDFSKYGKFFDMNNQKGDLQASSGDGWTDCLTRKPVIDTPANLGYTFGSGAPFTTKEMEHHAHTQEALFCQMEPIAFLVCEDSDAPYPEAEKVKAVILNPGEIAVLDRGVWHSSAHGINGPTNYFYLAHAYDGEPTEWVSIKGGPVEVDTKVRQYSTYKKELFNEKQSEKMNMFCSEHRLEGTEVFMDDILSRDKTLFNNSAEKENIIKNLLDLNVKRIHCSYWAYPTSFLTKNNFRELIERFGNSDDVIKYYGDLTGSHMFQRWMQEYEIACEINAQAYTFHLIDYAPIDGKWEFTISKEEIRQAMIFMIQQFINNLMDKKLLTDNSPQIEVENAGWGLEYGIQTAEDYNLLFSQIYDPFKKVKIGWDINHLLHSIGFDEVKQIGRFFLQDNEISKEMKSIELQYGNKPEVFAQRWLEYNILHPKLIDRIGSLHLSDCAMKNIEYFRNGKLTGKYYKELSTLESWEEQENYGVNIVLTKYDSHIYLGEGILMPPNVKDMILKILASNPEIVILHELKNSLNQADAIKKQIDYLSLD